MSHSLSDLDALHSPEECASYIADLDARNNELEAAASGRQFTPEERGEWADLGDIKKAVLVRKAEFEARRARLETIVNRDETVEKPFVSRNVRVASQSHVPEDIYAIAEYRSRSNSEEQLQQAYRDGAMKVLERATFPHPQSRREDEQDHIAKLLDSVDLPTHDNPQRELARRLILTGSPAYERAFLEYLRTGRQMESRYTAGLVQSDAAGGYAVPFFFDPTILHVGAWTAINPYRQACKVVQIVGTDTYHGVTATAVQAVRAAEAAAVTEGGPATWAQVSAIVGKVHSMVTLSVEFTEDRADIVSEIASLIAEAKDTEEESIFTTGVGDALGNGFNPIGMFPAHGTAGMFTHVDTAASNTIAIGDVTGLEAQVPVRHRFNAAWFMNRGVLRLIQALETTGGELFGGVQYPSVGTPEISRVGNTGLRLLGYPVWEVPSAPSSAVTDNAMVAFLGDPSNYLIVDRIGMNLEVIPHIFGAGQGNMPTGNRGVYAWWRNTAKPRNVDGGRLLAALA